MDSMDNKFYVSLEAARLLKEKGYNEVTNAAWCGFFGEMKIAPQNCGYSNLDYPDDMKLYSAPTKAEAIDWLESKGINIELRTMYCESKQVKGWHWFYAICKGDCIDKINECNDCIKLFPTRLEAEEAAIIKACELL